MGKEMEQEDRGRGTVMKKTFVILLAAVTVLMGGLISVYAEDNAAEEQKIFKVDIKKHLHFIVGRGKAGVFH